MMKLILLLSVVSMSQSSTTKIKATGTVGDCLGSLVTKELTASYNYLQMASKLGADAGYPGFASFYTKLSDDISSKAHDLTKFLAKRQFPVQRLISKSGISVASGLSKRLVVSGYFHQALEENTNIWTKVMECHTFAGNAGDAHVQDYLESEFLHHHNDIEKLLSDIDHRLKDSTSESERSLVTFMIDEELLQTYGDRRKNIFG